MSELERRMLLVLLLALTCVLVGLYAWDKSGRDDFWLAGVALVYGLVLGRLFWTPKEPEPLSVAYRSPVIPPPPHGDTMVYPPDVSEQETLVIDRDQWTEPKPVEPEEKT